MSLWIDLTDFLKWSGNLTGIQRIQYNLSKKYIESGQDVKFFIYSEAGRSFEEVQFVPDDIVKYGVVSSQSGQDASDNSLDVTPRWKRGIRKLLRSQPSHAPQLSVACPFQDGDIILVMGGIWVGSFIDDIASCKDALGFKFVHFAFDMIPTLLPGYVVDWLPEAFSSYQKKVFSIAEGIIAISESTKRDVERFIKENGVTNSPRIVTVRIGESINEGNEVVGDETSHELLDLHGEEFILSVSTFEARKNHASLFYVTKEARRRGIALPKIVIAGRDGWLTDDIRYMMQHDPEAAKAILILNHVNDNDLSWLYENCRFTIFPSFYEGWGMPIAESLAYGKLCLASDTSSMPEIAGDLIDYFSPYDTGAILDCIGLYLDDGNLAAKVARIKAEYKATSWDEMFCEVSGFVTQIYR